MAPSRAGGNLFGRPVWLVCRRGATTTTTSAASLEATNNLHSLRHVARLPALRSERLHLVGATERRRTFGGGVATSGGSFIRRGILERLMLTARDTQNYLVLICSHLGRRRRRRRRRRDVDVAALVVISSAPEVSARRLWCGK